MRGLENKSIPDKDRVSYLRGKWVTSNSNEPGDLLFKIETKSTKGSRTSKEDVDLFALDFVMAIISNNVKPEKGKRFVGRFSLPGMISSVIYSDSISEMKEKLETGIDNWFFKALCSSSYLALKFKREDPIH